MAEAQTLTVLINAKDNASPAINGVKTKMQGLGEAFEKHRMKIGMAATAIGGAITGIAVTSVQSAVEQRKTIDMLDNALQTVGKSYEQNKEQIEALAAAQQAKTNFGDEESRQSLQTLIRVSGDYETSMQALVIAQDISAGSGKALEAVTEALARAIGGEEAALKAFLPTAVNGMGVTELLAQATEKYAGAAEAAFDPATQLAQTFSDLQDAIGTSLLSNMDGFLATADGIVRSIVTWIERNPELSNAIIAVTTVIGGFLIVGGPLLIMLPMLAAGWGMLNLAMLPVTLTIVGISAAIYAGMQIWQNWDKVVAMFKVTIAGAARLFINLGLGFVKTAKAIISALAPFVPGLKKWEKGLEDLELKMQNWDDEMVHMGARARQVGDDVQDAAQQTANKVENTSQQSSTARTKEAETAEEMSRQVVKAEEAKAQAAAEASQKQIDALVEVGKKRLEAKDAAVQEFLAIRKAAADTATAQREGVDALVAGFDEGLLQWQKSGATHKEIMKSIQQVTGDSFEEIGAAWKIAGTDVTNHEHLLARFLEATGKNFYSWSLTNEANLKRVSDATGALTKKFGDLRHEISQSASEDFAEDWESVTAPTPTPKSTTAATTHSTTRTGDLAGLEGASMQAKLGQFADQTERTIRSQGVRANPVMNKAQLSRLTKQQIDKGWSAEKAGSYAEHLKAIGYAERASGGPAGGLTLVGERGPELVSLPQGSFVHASGTGPAGTVNHFHFHGAVYGVEDLKETVVEAVRDHAISGGFSGVFAEA